MKKLILISALLLSCASAFAQRSYYFKEPQKNVTFQVSAGLLDYDGLKYGWSLGVNVKEMVSVNFFHARDYTSAEGSWLDSRLGGMQATLVLPVNDCIQVGGGIRIASLNNGHKNEFQSPIFSGEMRVNLNESLKLAFEYGMSNKTNIASVRLLFNLY